MTLNLKDIPVSELVQVDLAKEKDALSKRLRRFGIIACIGNMEIAYKPRRNKWCLHVHLLVFGHSKKELKSFCQTFPMKRAGLVQEISDPLVQITYLFKYGTSYHFPGSKRPWPLPDQRLVELARWRSRYKFNDHLLLIGFRRHGTIMLNSDIAKKLSRRRLGDVET